MTAKQTEDYPSLSDEEISKFVHERLNAYKGLSILEKYAMFMGKAQILELGLKGLLTRKFGVDPESMEKLTLGSVKNELEQRRLRPDFITLLSRVVDYRNYFAHDFLMDNAITKSMANFSDRKLHCCLIRATYELEQIIILYD